MTAFEDHEHGIFAMRDKDSEWVDIWRAVTNIVGFHDLAETPGITELQRLEYDAQVYAGGVELARRIIALTKSE